MGLENKYVNEIKKAGKKYGIQKIILFGSRALGTQKKHSDVDIAILCKDRKTFLSYKTYLEYETSVPYTFDVIRLSDVSHKKLLKHIEDHGILLM